MENLHNSDGRRHKRVKRAKDGDSDLSSTDEYEEVDNVKRMVDVDVTINIMLETFEKGMTGNFKGAVDSFKKGTGIEYMT
eukprot:13595062-Ditylum_brightwellii.AAC.1